MSNLSTFQPHNSSPFWGLGGLRPLLPLILLLLFSLPLAAQEIDFINNDANRIVLNGDDWSALRKALKSPKSWHDGKFQLVQIGDSHIQPDIMTAQVRRRMQDKWGNGGRGLIPAFYLAKTNEPTDYILKSSTRVKDYSRILSRNWTTDIGLTGVAVRFDTAYTELYIKAKVDGDQFTRVTLLHAPKGGYETASSSGEIFFAKEISPWAQQFQLKQRTDTVTLGVPCPSDFYGAILTNDKRGVMVHSIGNNGATYSSYCKVADFGEQLKVLQPQLVIISLGTNEAFGNLTGVENYITRFITDIRKHNPKARFLLTTPMECQKRVSRQVAQQVKVGGGKRKKKARYKTVYKTVTSYAANEKVNQVRQLILDYGRRHKIATWDLYQVAGGSGASNKWVAAGLMNPSDHLHQLESGYELQGMLLADALLDALK
jgi:lysophospholipase L1-like esterase